MPSLAKIHNSIAAQKPYSYLTDSEKTNWLFKSSLVRFESGQTILRPDELSASVYLIVQGEIRLLSNKPNRGELFTLCKQGVGQLIGWVSLLTGMPCEYTTASTDVLALKLSSKEFLSCYKANVNFADNFHNLISPQESAIILSHLIENDIFQNSSWASDFQKFIDNSLVQTVFPGHPLSLKIETNEDYDWYFGSLSTDEFKYGDKINANLNLPRQGKLDLPFRIIGFPSNNKNLKLSSDVSMLNEIPKEEPLSLSIKELSTIDNDMPLDNDRYPFLVSKTTLGFADSSCEMICMRNNVPYRKDVIRNVLRSKIERNKTISLEVLGALLEMLGFRVVLASIKPSFVGSLEFPSIFMNQSNIPCVIHDFDGLNLIVADPSKGKTLISYQEFVANFGEELLFLTPSCISTTPIKNFGWSWFIPLVKRYKNSLILVFLASLMAQLFGLAIPLLIQQIIDKVLSQGNLSSLNILGSTMIVLAIFQGLLTALRTYIFVDTTDRMDLALGSAVIARLLALRLSFFDRRPVGELSQRLGELNTIRNFMTGTALVSVLNIVFATLYLVVMIVYSPLLTAVALSTIPIYILMVIFISPIYRSLIRRRAVAQAQTQSHLIEVLSGIQTVKAQHFELTARWKWQERYKEFIDQGFRSVALGTTTGVIGGFLNTLSGLLILWVGMWLVLDGQLTLGMLIAFRIISGNVIGPLTQLATLYQGFQKVQLSMERVSDIVDQQPEFDHDFGSDNSQISLPPLKGGVSFDDVSFSFQKSRTQVLKDINLEVKPGQFVAIVGQSGSGKSTLTKLIARLYDPSKGRIYLDQYDISKVNLSSLRSQIGIVPQDSLLFEGSVSENIALNDPQASNESIIEVSKIACAHDFIMELSSGYATGLAERGSNLSGGQRQRIAIARTLLANPQLLIMDEATSALDYNNESVLCANLKRWASDKTVLFITHRLASIRSSDLIVVMHEGRIAEFGTHKELMDNKSRYYAMYNSQGT